MKEKKVLLIAIVVTVLLALVVNTVLGQEPELQEDVDSVTPVPPLPEPEETPAPAEGEAGDLAAREIGSLAVPAKTMNYQGYLTDGSGTPLYGTYDLTFSLYNAVSGGTQRWGPETHTSVSVDNGFFSEALGETVPLDPYTVLDEQLYLEVTVNGTPLPRQMLRAVPYAMGLTAGAQVRGATDSMTQFGLRVQNDNGRGIYADGLGDNIYGIYNADITYSSEGYAGPDTYIWIPAQNAVIDYDDRNDAHIEIQNYGEAIIQADLDLRTVVVHIPIQIERPYGRNYLLREARVYYEVNADASIHYGFIRGRDFSTGTVLNIATNDTEQMSEVFDYFTIQPTDPYTVTTAVAPTNIEIQIYMDTAAGTVNLYGVRLRLDSDY